MQGSTVRQSSILDVHSNFHSEIPLTLTRSQSQGQTYENPWKDEGHTVFACAYICMLQPLNHHSETDWQFKATVLGLDSQTFTQHWAHHKCLHQSYLWTAITEEWPTEQVTTISLVPSLGWACSTTCFMVHPSSAGRLQHHHISYVRINTACWCIYKDFELLR